MTIIVDRTAWGRLRVAGADHVRFLQGLTTVNVETLAEGSHGWGAILNPKGRVLSVIDIARHADAFVIACEPALADKTRAILERYAVMDDVTFEVITGPAHQRWATPGDVWAAPFVEGAVDGTADSAVALDELAPEVERLRIRAGFMRYDADVSEGHFPFETPLVQFLDYGKGCYVGQEPVFRVHSQGNASRMLRAFEVEGSEPLAAGTPIVHPAKDPAGSVTSSVRDGDRTLALGYLHRTAWTPGDRVEIAGRGAIVHELPWS